MATWTEGVMAEVDRSEQSWEVDSVMWCGIMIYIFKRPLSGNRGRVKYSGMSLQAVRPLSFSLKTSVALDQGDS